MVSGGILQDIGQFLQQFITDLMSHFIIYTFEIVHVYDHEIKGIALPGGPLRFFLDFIVKVPAIVEIGK